MSRRAVTDAELDAAISALSDPARLREAQTLVAQRAPGLQRVLAAALAEGGWFDRGHRQAVSEAVSVDDHVARLRAVDTLLAEETRLAMLVGVAVGYELGRELDGGRGEGPPRADREADERADREAHEQAGGGAHERSDREARGRRA